MYCIIFLATLATVNGSLPDDVVDCGKWSGEACKAKGPGWCVGEGWYSKINGWGPYSRVPAHDICIDEGYPEGADPKEKGGNYRMNCRYPGETIGKPNKQGGKLDHLGEAVSWKCKGRKKYQNPVLQECQLPSVVTDCGNGLYSKVNLKAPFQRVNAREVCKAQGYDDVDYDKWGLNLTRSCNKPLGKKWAGQVEAMGYAVSWRCVGTKTCDTVEKVTWTEIPKEETPSPTPAPKGEACVNASSYKACKKAKNLGCIPFGKTLCVHKDNLTDELKDKLCAQGKKNAKKCKKLGKKFKQIGLKCVFSDTNGKSCKMMRTEDGR